MRRRIGLSLGDVLSLGAGCCALTLLRSLTLSRGVALPPGVGAGRRRALTLLRALALCRGAGLLVGVFLSSLSLGAGAGRRPLCRRLAFLLCALRLVLLCALGLARLVAVATALPHGLVLLPALRLILPKLPLALLRLVRGAAAVSHSFAALRARLPGGAFGPAACSRLRGAALRHAFTAGSAGWTLRHPASRLPAFGGTAGSATGADSAASTHSATACTFTHTLRRRQADAGEQHRCGQQEPALSNAVHLNLLRLVHSFATRKNGGAHTSASFEFPVC